MRWLTPARRRALSHGLALGLVLMVGYYDVLVLAGYAGLDAHAYWAAWRHDLYGIAAAHPDAYLYSPAFAELLWPLTRLPWEVFLVVWATGMTAVFAWLLRPLPPVWFVPCLLLCLPEALEGNVNALLALTVVAGFRHPAAWAFALLTKVSTALGLVWFAVRGEWRALVAPLALAAAIAAVSYLVRPDLWHSWLALLAGGAAGGGGNWLFPARLIGGVVLVGWGARGGRRWTVPVGVVLGSPILFLNTLTILAALPRLRPLPTLSGERVAAGSAGVGEPAVPSTEVAGAEG